MRVRQDQSFVCALTLHGWKEKPNCFDFLERAYQVCQTHLRYNMADAQSLPVCERNHKKCVRVRVIDSCAGCRRDEKHVDLTQAPFRQLAPLSAGELEVYMRRVEHKPEKWRKDLWGPKVNGH